MQAPLDQSHSASRSTQNHWVSLGQNHGYRFEGDTAILNAELAIEPLARGDELDRAEHWALQLWACDAPHQGGPLQGIKVAEAALALPTDLHSRAQGHDCTPARDYLETAAFAQLPPAQRAYSMVLVLASGTAGAYDQVHDFSNYPARQEFAAPHLDGSVGYRFEDDTVVLQAEGVRNPRDVDNISGSLSLELWALRAPYAGGAFEGVLLGSTELERLSGQSEERDVERRVALAQAPAGVWQLALMLREWTEAAGYLTRDYCNFADVYRVASTGDADPSPVQSQLDARTEEPATSTDVWAEQPAVSLAAAPTAEPAVDSPLAATTSEPVAAESPAPAVTEPVAAVAEPVAAVTEPVAAVSPEPVATPSQVASPVVDAPSEAVSKVGETAPSSAKPATPTATTATRTTPVATKKPQLAAVAPAAESRVSVQTGSVDDLAAVPGLNKKVAAAIVRARPFASLDDLRRVRGIGDKMLQQLRAALTL